MEYSFCSWRPFFPKMVSFGHVSTLSQWAGLGLCGSFRGPINIKFFEDQVCRSVELLLIVIPFFLLLTVNLLYFLVVTTSMLLGSINNMFKRSKTILLHVFVQLVFSFMKKLMPLIRLTVLVTLLMVLSAWLFPIVAS
jgi:hypothetical protein